MKNTCLEQSNNKLIRAISFKGLVLYINQELSDELISNLDINIDGVNVYQ